MANSKYLSGLLFKAVEQYCAASCLFFAIAILVPVLVPVEDEVWSKYIAINFFVSLLTTLCYLVLKMTVGGQNVFSVPLFLLLKLFGNRFCLLEGRSISPGGVVILYALLVGGVSVTLRIKLPDASLLSILFAGVLNLLLPLALWGRSLSGMPSPPGAKNVL